MTTYTEVDLDVSLASICMGDATSAQQMRASRYVDELESIIDEISLILDPGRIEKSNGRDIVLWVGQHESHRLALAEQVESLQKDARRYRILRDRECALYNGEPFIASWNAGGVSQWTGEHADRQIDAAQQVEANHE